MPKPFLTTFLVPPGLTAVILDTFSAPSLDLVANIHLKGIVLRRASAPSLPIRVYILTEANILSSILHPTRPFAAIVGLDNGEVHMIDFQLCTCSARADLVIGCGRYPPTINGLSLVKNNELLRIQHGNEVTDVFVRFLTIPWLWRWVRLGSFTTSAVAFSVFMTCKYSLNDMAIFYFWIITLLLCIVEMIDVVGDLISSYAS
ncbi:hypothetical protein BDN72DRAFT_928212 [Pluteus cervinus]|uniref:Uncharacterized protein n=1 Tax=Pluteus cervinus TaxID=181527 RepID=A0ACD3ACQ2_9AGAR|nr:hypothetical protein BDN72DRAFT_928212 [Pluteus cervinus]